MDEHFIQNLLKPADTKIVLLVIDGLGGLPRESDGLTELEAAITKNLDILAARSICGLQEPVGAGITPGSGPSHLALFGYNPLKYQVGRGVLSALGIDFDLGAEDVAARGNFCTINGDGRITDRRAGRISTKKNEELCEILQGLQVPAVEVFLKPVKEHRFLLVLRGQDLSDEISDTDPQQVGVSPLPPEPLSPEAKRTAILIESFLMQAQRSLQGYEPANMVLLRGFSKRPRWPMMKEVFGLNPAAIAGYPMYRGLAKLIGMEVLEAGDSLEELVDVLERHWKDFDFFFIHVKQTDSAGEDGDFDRKVAAIEQVDAQMPRMMSLGPDVVIVTGDHSTPSLLRSHSWHPVPVLLWSKYCRSDTVKKFEERACILGGLGPRFPACDLIPLALANALRLEKFGA